VGSLFARLPRRRRGPKQKKKESSPLFQPSRACVFEFLFSAVNEILTILNLFGIIMLSFEKIIELIPIPVMLVLTN
jgi:hypothetical protein